MSGHTVDGFFSLLPGERTRPSESIHREHIDRQGVLERKLRRYEPAKQHHLQNGRNLGRRNIGREPTELLKSGQGMNPVRVGDSELKNCRIYQALAVRAAYLRLIFSLSNKRVNRELKRSASSTSYLFSSPGSICQQFVQDFSQNRVASLHCTQSTLASDTCIVETEVGRVGV